ncbi:MAG TPA: response regulator [Acetobacteraceae bacterium]|jgi:two-component system response regulator FixJ
MEDGHRLYVAVVDDDDAVRDSLCFLLEAAGCDVLTFASAAEFFARAEHADIACLLVDQHMPQMTGLELAAKVRETQPGLPMALMTGSPSPELTRRAFELGVTEMLEKPLQEQGLLAFVQAALG